MKNKYSPISDSDDSSKTLNDEKADSRSSPSDGTPPPYSVSKKNVDLEMADGSAQNSAQDTVNNIRSDPLTNKEWWKNFFVGIMTIIAILYNTVFLAIVFGYKVSPYTNVFYGLAGGSIGSIFIFLFTILVTYPEWYRQTGRLTKNVLSAMCISVLCVCFLDVLGFTAYYAAKKFTGFEKINNNFFYAVCFVNFVLFLYLTMNANARERLRLVVVDMGNGMSGLGNGINGLGNGINGLGNGINGLGHGLGNAVVHMFGTNRGDEAPRNEEIELQPLAEQRAEV
ncbi:wtf meiotic driver [Schizosaccharomyces osmophilus]|uniref:Wtf meiotic driver n=1 Tax=Schizosaccharomyces osmophilus TaxID=2545709 RepID=A0AAE9WBA1_9SCHI|nr:wtf meiotic driver [Schizosaccharomyces osmophilus]WBW73035.1 wtf meiotic driver [Schizosaccharomyces osmophilus]